MVRIKGWKSERHKVLKSEVNFWRNTSSRGFVKVNKVQKGSSANLNYGAKYDVEINTPRTLRTLYFKKRQQALKFAMRWMKRNPRG